MGVGRPMMKGGHEPTNSCTPIKSCNYYILRLITTNHEYHIIARTACQCMATIHCHVVLSEPCNYYMYMHVENSQLHP